MTDLNTIPKLVMKERNKAFVTYLDFGKVFYTISKRFASTIFCKDKNAVSNKTIAKDKWLISI